MYASMYKNHRQKFLCMAEVICAEMQISGLKQRIKPVLPCTLQSLHNKPQWRKFEVNRQYIFSEQPVSLQ